MCWGTSGAILGQYWGNIGATKTKSPQPHGLQAI